MQIDKSKATSRDMPLARKLWKSFRLRDFLSLDKALGVR